MTANEVLRRWIEDANAGRIKDGTRELSNDELALVSNVLRAVAGDLLVQPVNADSLDGWWLKWHGKRLGKDAWDELREIALQ